MSKRIQIGSTLIMMDEVARQTLHTTLTALREMAEQGDCEPQWYYKALVSGAHEHLRAGEAGQAIFLLGKVPADYYAETIVGHMDDDPAYAEQAFEIATFLVKTNVVHVGLTEEEQSKVQQV
jgi:hypothetical protein